MRQVLPWVLCLAALQASASTVSFTGSGTGPGGVPVSAAANFEVNNANKTLTIRLRNTSGPNAGTDVPGSTLTGLFWDFKTGQPNLTPMTATVAPGSSIVGTCSQVNCAGVTNVAGEFGYRYQVSGFPEDARYGVSSSGYLTSGLTGNVGNFNGGAAGPNLDNPTSLDGINFGIISSAPGFNPNQGLASVPLVNDAVTFVLSYAQNVNLNADDIWRVSYQYGTDFCELNIPGDPPERHVPEPGPLSLMGLGLMALGFVRRQ